jgi:hypothetical protein
VKGFLVYTAARLGVFLATYALVVGVYLLVTDSENLPILWPLLVAAVLSTVVSAYLLRGQRDRLAAGVQARAERISARYERMRSKEDTD